MTFMQIVNSGAVVFVVLAVIIVVRVLRNGDIL